MTYVVDRYEIVRELNLDGPTAESIRQVVSLVDGLPSPNSGARLIVFHTLKATHIIPPSAKVCTDEDAKNYLSKYNDIFEGPYYLTRLALRNCLEEGTGNPSGLVQLSGRFSTQQRSAFHPDSAGQNVVTVANMNIGLIQTPSGEEPSPLAFAENVMKITPAVPHPLSFGAPLLIHVQQETMTSPLVTTAVPTIPPESIAA